MENHLSIEPTTSDYLSCEETIYCRVASDIFQRIDIKDLFLSPEIYGYGNCYLKDTTSSIMIFIFTLQAFSTLIIEQLKNQLYRDIFGIHYDAMHHDMEIPSLSVNENKLRKLQSAERFLHDFYNFVLKLYAQKIISDKTSFYFLFNEEIFGLDFKEQMKHALQHYKELYKSVMEEVATIPINTIIEIKYRYNDYDSFETPNKLEIVNHQKLKFQNLLIHLRSYIIKLTSHKYLFDPSVHRSKHSLIEIILKYEVNRQIMIELNDKYSFENQTLPTFSENDVNKYKKYSHLFNSIEAYSFTKNKIHNFKSAAKVESVSLYQMLIDYNF
jgi:hypothetical protein